MRLIITLSTILAASSTTAASLPVPLGPANFAYGVFAGDSEALITVDAGNATLEVQNSAESSSSAAVESFFPFPDSTDTVTRQGVARVEGFGAPVPQVVASATASATASTNAPLSDAYRPRRINQTASATSRLIYEFVLLPTGFFGEIGDPVPIDVDIFASFSLSTQRLGMSPGITSARASASGQVFVTEGQVSRVGTAPTADGADVVFNVNTDTSKEFTQELEGVLEAGQVYSITKYATAFTSVLAETRPNSQNDGSATAQAVVDPVISIDQDRFDNLYAAECLIAFGGPCPDVSDLYSLEFSAGVSQGATPIPVPASALLLASALGFAGLHLRWKRRQGVPHPLAKDELSKSARRERR